MKRALRYWFFGALLTVMTAGMSSASTFPADLAQSQRAQDRISHEVRHELVMLPQYSLFDNLAYKVDGYNVTLIGQVRNAILKDSAEKVVKSIEGVEHVDNQIEILPASFNDDRIRRHVARAIFNDARLFTYSIQPVPSIHIVVKNGHVTLDGVVATQTDKDTANLRANGVPGIFSVENNLIVENRSEAKK